MEGPTNKMNIYFCGSIRGGRQDVHIYEKMVKQMKEYGKVLTEVVADPTLPETDRIPEDVGDKGIHDQDVGWMKKSEVVIAECTQPSHGVGYELGIAKSLGKETFCLFRKGSGRLLSAMIRGAADSRFHIIDYDESDIEDIIRNIMISLKNGRKFANGQ